ncbi:MAG: VWA domain-containing protein, partial [Pirellulaceae bacterium]|nr:VWA domain-containing protein [Pirellulaceae bacterium]
KMEKMNSSRNLMVKSLAVYCFCLLLLTGCDQVKFKPVHGHPPPPAKAQPRVAVVNTPQANSTADQAKKQRTSQPRPGNQKDESDQDENPKFDTTSEFSFDVTSFGASTFSRSGSGKHTSKHPVLAKEEAIKLVVKLIGDSVDYGPTLVVWLLDQSDSGRGNIMDLGQQLSAPYAELTKGQPENSVRLLTAVVSFGEKVEFTIDPPTVDASRVIEAISTLKEDKSGKEMTFSAVGAALEKYLPFRTKQRREVIFIVVTDEAGDDGEMVDSVVVDPRRYGIPIYVLGVPAPFGRSAGMAQTAEAPIDYRPSGAWQPIRQGPESRLAERIQLGFWGGSTDMDLLESGFGPFALERLAATSGGRFLALRPSGGYGSQWPSPGVPRFDPKKMRRYAPDNTTDEEYQKKLDGNAACRSLTEAARLSDLELMAFPDQEFVKQSEAQLTTLLAKAQQVAAKLEPAIIKLHETLKKGAKDREKLTSPRWQAGYDLAMGRATAARARIEGYNAMLAAIKRGKKFEDESSNTWVLESADTIEASSALERLVDDAKEHLQRVVDEHPGTPWALIAERELAMPIGWKWTER